MTDRPSLDRSGEIYNGWHVYHDPGATMDQAYRAERWGSGISAGTLDEIRRLVDEKVREAAANGRPDL
jgi:hypothetical protein